MPILPDKLPERGKLAGLARRFNQLRDYVRTLSPIPSPNTLYSQTAIGSSRSALASETVTAGSNTVRLYLDAVSQEFLTCRRVDSNSQPTGDPFYVVRPLELRKDAVLPQGSGAVTSIDPQTRSFNLAVNVQGVGTVTFEFYQVVYPAYVPGRFIWATNGFSDYSQTAPDNTTIDWLDLNLDARQWQFDRQTFAVCVLEGGVRVTKYAQFLSTKPGTVS